MDTRHFSKRFEARGRADVNPNTIPFVRGPQKGWKQAKYAEEESSGPRSTAKITQAVSDASLPPIQHDSFAYTNRKGLHFRGSTSGYALLNGSNLRTSLGDNENLIQLEDSAAVSEASSSDFVETSITQEASLALVSSFFDNIYPSWPVIFPLAYQARCCEDLLNELQPSLLAAIQALAWGSVHQRRPELDLPPRSWFMKTAWNQIAQYWPIQGTIVAAQTLTLLSLASYGSGDYSSAWTVCAMACAMVQHMGLQ